MCGPSFLNSTKWQGYFFNLWTRFSSCLFNWKVAMNWLVQIKTASEIQKLFYYKVICLYVYLGVLGMRFNELPSWRNFISHQHTKNTVCFCSAFNGNLF